MNIQPGRMNSTTPPLNRSNPGAALRQIRFFASMICIVLCIATAAVIHVYLGQRITDTNREIQETRDQITQTRNELTHLRNKVEYLSNWKHIRQQIARYQLPLVSAVPGQVRSMRFFHQAQSDMIYANMLRSASFRQAADARPAVNSRPTRTR